MQRLRFASLFVLTCIAATTQPSADVPGDHTISPAGEKLAKLLDSTGVDHLWQPGHYCDWETGQTRTVAEHENTVKSSHCSTYAAAIAERLGVYLLRPPEHMGSLLANAQYGWLSKDGSARGWKPVDSAEDAQADANAGELVVAVYRAPDPKKPGHIAILRPAVRTESDLEEKGPEIIQAGATNYMDTTVSVGFNHHPGAWDGTGKGVKFYAHPIDANDVH